MKYAVIKVTDGNYNIHAEGFTDKDKAFGNFHALCSALWNDTETLSAECAVVDENLDVVEGHKEHIYHEPTPAPEPEPTPESEG